MHRLSKPAESIDKMVDEKREEILEINNRFMVDGVCCCPLCKSLQLTGEKTMIDNIYCFVDLGDTRRLARIVRANSLTLWVKIMIGAKTSISIKRHKIKHHVGGYHETIHS
jgi:hypothetical protein